jgi:hypothetical protein
MSDFKSKYETLQAQLDLILEDINTRLNRSDTERLWMRAGAHTLHSIQVRQLIEASQPTQDELHDIGELCEFEKCQECCSHDERDHGICLDCEHENDGSGAADWAYEMSRDIN